MSSLQQSILTAALTVLAGAFTFALTQVFLKALLEPAMELKREIGRIAHSLVFYANKRSIPEAVVAFRQHASKLRELVNVISCYDWWQLLFSLPSKEAVLEASADLIGHSNGENFEKEINLLLNIKTYDDMVRNRTHNRKEI